MKKKLKLTTVEYEYIEERLNWINECVNEIRNNERDEVTKEVSYKKFIKYRCIDISGYILDIAETLDIDLLF